MSYVYPTVTISGQDYSVVGSLDDANAYLAAAVTASAWALQTDDDAKGRDLVSANRWLASLMWLGSKTDDSQALPWPRTGIQNVDPDTIPDNVKFASYEIAAALEDDPTLFTSLYDPAIREMRAGAVDVSFFRPHDVQWLGVVPKSALFLIQAYLASSAPTGAPIPSGFCKKSPLDRRYDFEHGI